MIFRNLERKPLRAMVTLAGIAGSTAIIISGTFWSDGLEYFIDVQFNKVLRSDVQVAFAEPVPRSVRRDLERLPGVKRAEVTRVVPARLAAGHRGYRTAITGVEEDATLVRIVDARLAVALPSQDGVVLTERLARRLGVRAGDRLRAETLEGRRPELELRVAGTVDEMAGMNAWMRMADLNRLMGDGELASAAQLAVDRRDEAGLLARLKDTPAAAVVTVNRSLLASFRANNARNMLVFTGILTALAAVIAVGVVYNNARIQLAERAWELASLRVLGFTRREVSVMLLGELAFEIAVAIPLGFAGGYALAVLLLALMPHELMALPLVILPSTYLYAALTVACAGVASALVVRDRIDRLDLVGVLKTRE
jgi:putative ABC transport system permease protein